MKVGDYVEALLSPVPALGSAQQASQKWRTGVVCEQQRSNGVLTGQLVICYDSTTLGKVFQVPSLRAVCARKAPVFVCIAVKMTQQTAFTHFYCRHPFDAFLFEALNICSSHTLARTSSNTHYMRLCQEAQMVNTFLEIHYLCCVANSRFPLPKTTR